MQLLTKEFSGQGCACCFYCPTGQSAQSMSRPLPGWGGTLQSQLTSPQTGQGRSQLLKISFYSCGVCFFCSLLGNERCIQGCFSCTSCSRPAPLHWARVERPRCCYRKPPAAQDTVGKDGSFHVLVDSSTSPTLRLTHCLKPEVTSPDR